MMISQDTMIRKNTYQNILLFLVSPCRISLTWVPGAICLLGFLATIGIYYPGQVRLDAVVAYTQAVSGIYGDWHPPIMAATWRLMRFIVHTVSGTEGTGQGLFFLVQTSLVWSGIYLVVRSQKEKWQKLTQNHSWLSILAILLIAGCVCLEVIYRSRILYKDILMPACYLVAAGYLLNQPQRHWKKWCVGFIVLFFIFFGTALRHNAIFSAIPLLFWWLWTVTSKGAVGSNRRKVPWVLGGSLVLWFFMLGTIHFVNYSLLNCVRLYPLSERFYADIFMLNYRSSDFVMPPNTFMNDFDGINEDLFREQYNPEVLFINQAMRDVRLASPTPLQFTQESILIVSDEDYAKRENYREILSVLEQQDEPCALKVVNEKQLRETFPHDYEILKKTWVECVVSHPFLYLKLKVKFFVRFLARSSVFFFAVNGISVCFILSVILCFSFSRRRFDPSVMPFLMLAWSALFYVSPLLIFLTDDNWDNTRYLHWFFTAVFLAAFLFCIESPLFRQTYKKIIQVLEKYLKDRITQS